MVNTNIYVGTKTGTYCGMLDNGITSFLGIRYADPVKPWQKPEYPSTGSNETIDATKFYPACIQPYSLDEYASQNEMSADCLTLNIWTKDVSVAGKPVMVYIHGGSYVNGGNNDPITAGDGFIRNLPDGEDCILVVINYRLGIFSSLDLSVLDGYDAKYRDSLALNMCDQIMALKWINENIRAFGGDSENVTLFGQSAGSMSIAYLAANAEARQYFKRGIMQSGVPFFGLASKEIKKKLTIELCRDLGIKSVQELTEKDDGFWIKQISDIQRKYGGYICPRVIDSQYVTNNFWTDITAGAASEIDLMVGCTNGEMDRLSSSGLDSDTILGILYGMFEDCGETEYSMTPFENARIIQEYMTAGEDKDKRASNIFAAFATQAGSLAYAEAQAKHNKNVYTYSWQYMPDANLFTKEPVKNGYSKWGRALHCAELPILFDTAQLGYSTFSYWWLGLQSGQIKEKVPSPIVPPKFIQQVIHAWYFFAKTGNPNNPMIPKWSQYDESSRLTMVINANGWVEKEAGLMEDEKILSRIKPMHRPKVDRNTLSQRAKNLHNK